MNRLQSLPINRIPLFQQVYEYVLNRIRSKEWTPHDKLPSIRMLAQELQVNRLTVFKAYQCLRDDGYLYVKDKSGYFVLSQKGEKVDHAHPIIHSYIQNSYLSEIHQLEANYQFSTAVIDPLLLPNKFLSEEVRKIFDRYPKLLGTYAPVQGDAELLEELSTYFYQYHQLHVSTKNLVITTGAQQAIDLIAKVFVHMHDYVLIDSPTYSAAIDIFLQRGVHLLPVEIHSYGFDLDKVEELMKRHKPKIFYLNPTFHNPTGYTVPKEQRKRLVELAEKYQCLIVEDDSYHEIYFHETPPAPIFQYDTDGYVVYVRSFSKYVAPGLRICTMIAHPSLIQWLLKAKALADNGTPLLNQKAFLFFLTSERMHRHMEKLRIALQIRKEVMEEELQNTGLSWISPSGGLNLWVKLHEQIDMTSMLQQSIQQSVSFVPGRICDPGGRDLPYIRLSYSYLNENQIRQGIHIFKKVYSSLIRD
ncbi:PLP-dependent aminotransferase family protein [Bacillus sp. 03113]|uniref:aminotransferase-like domain-containing protein n=1 Tax=Bacillus sp. 03113 TaxID=2578211 RepID=UPI00215D0E69|nr:PLP-dependent aminotransferase family protein [Bacillus sp. 03113]